VSGVDNDPAAVWLANVLLASEMLPVLSRMERPRRHPLPALVRHGDGLAGIDEPVRAVIMNPPYGRVRLDEQERARFAHAVYGHANLYGLFVAAALESLDSEGVLAALVPTSFLAGRYFENLRNVLAKDAPLRALGFVDDRSGSFAGVLQETCLATFTRKRVRRTNITNISNSVTDVATVGSPRLASPWLLPRQGDDAPVAASAIRMRRSLASAGWKVSTGPLVWNRRKEDLSAHPGPSRVPVLWAADIDGGEVHRDKARSAVRYLSLRKNDEQVMVLDQPAVLVQRTTAPEQNRRLVAAYLSPNILASWGGRVVVENHVNVLRPAAGAKQSAITAEVLIALLATDTFDRLLRCLTGSVAVSAYELEALPLPADRVLRSWVDLLDEPVAFARAVASSYRPVGA